MKLHQATSRIKKALSKKDFIAALTHYVIQNNMVYASNGAMTSSCPVDQAGTHVVPADELEKAFAILGQDAEFVWTDSKLTVKQGKRRMSIQLLAPEDVALIEPLPNPVPVPKNFVQTIRKIRPFLSDDATRPWALTAWLHKRGNTLVWTATNNITVVEVEIGEGPDWDVQIPNFALDFVLEREEKLISFQHDNVKASFFFEDGSQLTTQLFSIKMPDQVSSVLDPCYEDFDSWEITEDWRDAYKSIEALSPEEVVFGESTMTAGRRQATMEVEVSTPQPLDTSKSGSIWCPKYLTPVMTVADRIDFSSYPKPCKFIGVGVRGLTLGKNI